MLNSNLLRPRDDYESSKIQRDDLNVKEKKYDLAIGVLVVILSIIAASFSFLPTFQEKYDWLYNQITNVTFACLVAFFVIALIILLLYLQKSGVEKKQIITRQEYIAEKKKNQILDAVFESLREVNSEKIRRTLRITYGSVYEWNPMNYEVNRLVYDVHDQIRSILIALQKVVISIDPDRFSDKNVSVDLVWCYPEDGVESDLPLLFNQSVDEEEHRWKLISSGDFSGNHTLVLDYLKDPCSFYTLLSCFGSWFANNKYKIQLQSEVKELFIDYLKDQGIIDTSKIIADINNSDSKKKKAFFIKNVKDFENTKMRKKKQTGRNDEPIFDGSVAGEVICVRNDNPEHILVKALLTINTYGEPIHIGTGIATPAKTIKKRSSKSTDKIWTPKETDKAQDSNGENGSTVNDNNGKSMESDSKSNNGSCVFDKFGLTEYDYEDLFMNQIIPTYCNLLASEMSQMYIRHMLNEGKISPFTGKKINPVS